jgi:hypothetical protein
MSQINLYDNQFFIYIIYDKLFITFLVAKTMSNIAISSMGASLLTVNEIKKLNSE